MLRLHHGCIGPPSRSLGEGWCGRRELHPRRIVGNDLCSLLHHDRITEKLSGRNTMPPHAALNRLPCVPTPHTTKNEHLSLLQLQDGATGFHGGRFGVYGHTSQRSPLDCL